MASRMNGETMDSDVTVVEDAVDYTRKLKKDTDAKWVAGLSPEDEALELLHKRQFEAAENERARAQMEEAMRNNAPRGILAYLIAFQTTWLRYPLLFGIVTVAALAWCLLMKEELLHLEFPTDEEEVWGFLVSTPSGVSERFWSTVAFPLAGPWILASVFAVLICFQIALASRGFAVLCGIGTALLSVGASAASVYLLHKGCSRNAETGVVVCDVPFIAYWVTSIFRVAAPVVAVSTVGPVFDGVKKTRWMWTAVLAAPSVFLALAIAHAVVTEAPNPTLFWLSRVVTIGSWAFFLLAACAYQRQFHVVHRTHPKRD